MSTLEELRDLFTRQEPLDEELRSWVFEGPFGLQLKHPLVFAVIGFDPERAAHYNLQLKYKQEYIRDKEEKGNWAGTIWIHERPYRLERFIEIEKHFNDKEYWEMLGSIIIDSENLWQNLDILKLLLANPSGRSCREYLMEEGEREALAGMADEIEIWRGCQWKNRMGLSWTTDKEKAIWFAKRLGCKKPYLHSGTVRKSDVIAYFLRRGENEILALPNKIKNKSMESLS